MPQYFTVGPDEDVGDIVMSTVRNEYRDLDLPGIPSTEFLLAIQSQDQSVPRMMRVVGVTEQTAMSWDKRGEVIFLETTSQMKEILHDYFVRRANRLRTFTAMIKEPPAISRLIH
jgi:hypothetical protein